MKFTADYTPADFRHDATRTDFRHDATRAVESVLARGCVPVIAGGSNRYLEALLDGEPGLFRRRYDCCFLWVDADLPVLDRYIRGRVDRMLEQGLVDEVRGFFRPDGDYSRGIRKAIGVPEMDSYFRMEAAGKLDGDNQLRVRLLAAAVDDIKANTCRLARRQLRKIRRLRGRPGWSLRRLDVTTALALKVGRAREPGAERAAWEAGVAGPATRMVATFLGGKTVDGGLGTTTTAMVPSRRRRPKRWSWQALARLLSGAVCSWRRRWRHGAVGSLEWRRPRCIEL